MLRDLIEQERCVPRGGRPQGGCTAPGVEPRSAAGRWTRPMGTLSRCKLTPQRKSRRVLPPAGDGIK